MFDLLNAPPQTHPLPARYSGPERRRAEPGGLPWLAATLDEIDYGLIVLGHAGEVLFLNRAARAALDDGHPLQQFGRALRARRPRDDAALRAALDGAGRGLRRLLTLGESGRLAAVSVVPLGPLDPTHPNATLVLLGRRQVCGELAVHGFARSHGLSPGETRVLEALCRGDAPQAIAEAHGVAISTVRTQIGAIRRKTGAGSIRELARMAAALPPLMGVLAPRH
jgi:DNA-binding CsgD family transcriptional regulator